MASASSRGSSTTSLSRPSLGFTAPTSTGQSRIVWSKYIAVVFLAIAPQECIVDKRNEPNVRNDAFISAVEVNIISKVIKKLKVKCHKSQM